MARETFEDWIPVETGDRVIQAMAQASVVEDWGRPEPMQSDTKQVPRSGQFAIAAVAKGAAYGETSGTNGYVELIARKAGGVARIAEEDLGESAVDILATKRTEAARALAVFFDNAALATTAAANGTTVLYTSVYRAVRTNDAATSYTADANYIATGGDLTYADISGIFGLVEDSIWYEEGKLFVAASPAFKALFRGLLDADGRPILDEANSAGPNTLLGVPIKWSMGLRTSATNTQAPTGNPLLIVGNRDLLIKGMAKLTPQIATPNPGFAVQRASDGVGFLTDEALLKAAMRRGFAVGAANAFAVLEKT